MAYEVPPEYTEVDMSCVRSYHKRIKEEWSCSRSEKQEVMLYLLDKINELETRLKALAKELDGSTSEPSGRANQHE